MPFTAGPGTIAVAIALGSNLPVGQPGFGAFVIGASAAALAVAAVVWLCYASADTLVALLGSSRARVIARLSAFLLLCVGTQITTSGITDRQVVVEPSPMVSGQLIFPYASAL